MKNLTTLPASNNLVTSLKLVFHTDPHHGWLAVKRDLLLKLNLTNQISSFSYQSRSGKTVYLEEDSDMNKFLKTAHDLGITITYSDRHKNHSPIRSYPAYKNQKENL